MEVSGDLGHSTMIIYHPCAAPAPLAAIRGYPGAPRRVNIDKSRLWVVAGGEIEVAPRILYSGAFPLCESCVFPGSEQQILFPLP